MGKESGRFCRMNLTRPPPTQEQPSPSSAASRQQRQGQQQQDGRLLPQPEGQGVRRRVQNDQPAGGPRAARNRP
eukprot:3242861-Prymnesium_polylepis.1